MFKLNLHTHSDFSTDSEATIEELCEAAIEAGIKVIAITDHADFGPLDPPFEADDYLAQLSEIKDKYKGRIKVLAGIEIGYRRASEQQIIELASKPFDMVTGVVHEVGEEAATITDEYGALEYFKKNPLPDAFVRYLEDVLQCVKFGYFDVLGHLDVINRYGTRYAEKMRPSEHYGILKSILEGVIRRDMALELNTSGFRHDGGELYPSLEIINLYRELGGEIFTIGSDAHCASDITSGYDRAGEIIQELDPIKFIYFENRVPVTFDLNLDS